MTREEAINAALEALGAALATDLPEADPADSGRFALQQLLSQDIDSLLDLYEKPVTISGGAMLQLLTDAALIPDLEFWEKVNREEVGRLWRLLNAAKDAFNDKKLKRREEQNAAACKALGLTRRLKDPRWLYLNHYLQLVGDPAWCVDLFGKPIEALILDKRKHSKDEALRLTAEHFCKSLGAMYKAIARANAERETPIKNLLPGNPANRTGDIRPG